MAAFTILLGGDLVLTARLKSQIAKTTVIAADSGMRHAKLLGITPALWVGDFDSAAKDLEQAYRTVPRVSFPRNKDMSDGEITVNAALDRGANRLVLCGAFRGKRTDHTLLHITLAITLAEKNIPCLLTSGDEEGWPLIPGHYMFDLPDGIIFSIVGFSPIEGLSIQGAKWPLHKAHLDFGSSWTLSNKICGTLAVSLQAGKGILLTRPSL